MLFWSMTNVEIGDLFNWERIGLSMTNVDIVNIKCEEYLSVLDSVVSVDHT